MISWHILFERYIDADQASDVALSITAENHQISGILSSLAAASFVTLFCSGNMHIVMGTRYINLGFTELFVPVIICIVALIYRNAVQVSEENSLTI